ncbi:hypothetical protein CI641_026310 [Escherichia coli]|nr:hypothetical protein CI641_026310 [Escherichia coli]
MRQQQDEPGRFSICSRQAAVVLNAVIHFTFSLPLATIFLVYAYSGFEESIYLFRAYKYDSSKS